jgi:hypothetical protein
MLKQGAWHDDGFVVVVGVLAEDDADPPL